MKINVILLLLVSLVLAVLPAGAEDGCSRCKGTGQVACVKHETLNVEGLKVGEFMCADCLDLECCHGVGWVPCPKCKDAAAAERAKARIEESKAHCDRLLEVYEAKYVQAESCRFVKERNARRKQGTEPPKPPTVSRVFLNVLACPHLTLLTDMAARRVSLKGNLTPLDAHQVHHLYLSRLREVLQDANALHQPGAFEDAAKPVKKEKDAPQDEEPPAMRACDFTLFVFANEEAQRRLTARLFEQETAGPLAGSSCASVWESPMQFGTDKDLHKYVYAAAAGGILHQYADDPRRSWEEKAKDERMPTWMTEGFQHILEMRRFGLCEEGGVQETKKVDNKRGSEGWNANNWPRCVTQLLAKGKARPFPELAKMGLDDMQCSDHQLAWSYMDLLLRKGLDKVAVMVPKLRKRGCDQAAILREVYGMTQGEFETQWKTFVTDHYK